jgi:putative methionine-R-sulfoxide reductase with GAF domain
MSTLKRLLAEDPSWLVLTAFGGSYKQTIGGYFRIPLSKGLMGAAATTRQTILVNDVTADSRYLATPGAAGRAELAVPILLGEQVLGVLNVESTTQFTSEDADGLSIVADQLAVAIEMPDYGRSVSRARGAPALAREPHDWSRSSCSAQSSSR